MADYADFVADITAGISPAAKKPATPSERGPGPTDVLIIGQLDDRQDVSVSIVPLGTYTLIFDGEETTALAVGDGNAAIQAALEVLPNVGAGNVKVTDYAVSDPNLFGQVTVTYTVTFVGDLRGTQPTLTGAGDPVPEIVQYDLGGATGGTWNIHPQIGYSLENIAFDATAAEIQSALRTVLNAGEPQWPNAVVEGDVGGPFTFTNTGPTYELIEWTGTDPDDKLTGGTGLTVTTLQPGGLPNVYVGDQPPMTGDIDLLDGWTGTLHAYKQGGRAYLIGSLIVGPGNGSFDDPIFELPPNFSPPVGRLISGEYHVLSTGAAYADRIAEMTADSGGYALMAIYGDSYSSYAAEGETVEFDVSWPLATP